MRRFDKKQNIAKANLIAEQRYLSSKGLIKESFHEADGTPIGVDAQHRPIKKQVDEIGPETAAKSITFGKDERSKQVLQDATDSLFSPFINADKPFFFKISRTDAPEPVKYILTSVIPDVQDLIVYFRFNAENGSDDELQAAYTPNKKEIVIIYDIRKDEVYDIQSNQFQYQVNQFTANFFVKGANLIRKAYFTANKHQTQIDGPDGEKIDDPKFNVVSKIKKQDFKQFSYNSDRGATPPPLPPPLPGGNGINEEEEEEDGGYAEDAVSELAKQISSSMMSLSDSYQRKDFALAVGKVLRDEFGSHCYVPFLKVLKQDLGV